MVDTSTTRPLRVAFFGTPDFAATSLHRLLQSPHVVSLVVTQPDRPRGRGHKVVEGPVKQLARARGIHVVQPARLKTDEFVDVLSGATADIGVVAAYGRMLPEVVLQTPPLGMINVHASLLPRYRGAAPVQRAVMAGETVTGVTIMRVVRELDAGPMLLTAERPIGPDETSEEVERALGSLGANLLIDALDGLVEGTITEHEQDHALATYAPRITREDGVIDWFQSAAAIHNRVRGLHPWPHAYSWIGPTRLLIQRTTVEHQTNVSAKPGTLVEASGDRLTVSTGEGVLRVLELQMEGRRPLTTRDFLAGHPLRPGTVFASTPPA